MLRFFRSNQLFVVFGLTVYAVILHLQAFLAPLSLPVQKGGWLSLGILEMLSGFHPVVSPMLALILVLLQAIYINFLVTKYRISWETTFLPAMMYVLLCSAVPEFLLLTPALLAQTFLIVALGEMLGFYRSMEASGNVFNVGFWIGIAALFYCPASLFLAFGFIGLGILRAFNLREILVMLMGYIAPLFLMLVYRFWFYSELSVFPDLPHIMIFDFIKIKSVYSWIYLGIFAFLCIWVLINIQALFYKTKMAQKKYLTVLYWMLVVAFGTILFQPTWHLGHLILMVIPLGILWGLYFLRIRELFAELFHLILFLGILLLQYRHFIFLQ